MQPILACGQGHARLRATNLALTRAASGKTQPVQARQGPEPAVGHATDVDG